MPFVVWIFDMKWWGGGIAGEWGLVEDEMVFLRGSARSRFATQTHQP